MPAKTHLLVLRIRADDRLTVCIKARLPLLYPVYYLPSTAVLQRPAAQRLVPRPYSTSTGISLEWPLKSGRYIASMRAGGATRVPGCSGRRI